MNSFIIIKLIYISLSVLLIDCQEDNEEPEYDFDNQNQFETHLSHSSEILISGSDGQNISKIHVEKDPIENPIDSQIESGKESPIETTTTTTTPIPTTLTTTTTADPTTTTISTTSGTLLSSTLIEFPTNIPENEFKGCVKISLNAKIIFKYESNEGNKEEIELSSGNSNGQLNHPNRCGKRQHIVISYEQIEKTQLSFWLNMNDSHIYADDIIFEFPIKQLPIDYNRPENLQTCSVQSSEIIGFNFSPMDKCLVANNSMKNYIMPYKMDEHMNCFELPSVSLETLYKNESIQLQITNFHIIVTNEESDKDFPTDNGICPLIPNNTENEISESGQTKIWLGVTYAIVGAIFIFGIVLLYEKVIRKKYMYNEVKRNEPEA